MTYRIIVEPYAERELFAARDWYDARRRGLGLAFVEAVDEAMKRIAAMPEACPLVPGVSPELGARRAFVKRFPFAVVFTQLDEASVAVVAVAHQRRRPGYWLERLEGSIDD